MGLLNRVQCPYFVGVARLISDFQQQKLSANLDRKLLGFACVFMIGDSVNKTGNNV